MKGIALAAFVVAANARATEGPLFGRDEANGPGSRLEHETLFDATDVAASPLLAEFNAPHPAATIAPQPASFARLMHPDVEQPSNSIVALTGAALEEPVHAAAPSLAASDIEIAPSRNVDAPVSPGIPTRSESPPPDPVPTAIATAIARLIVHDNVSPLGDGDWRAARAAIGAFYADRGFAAVWVGEAGLSPAGRAVLSQLELAPEDGLNLSAFALPRHLTSRLSPDDLARAETTIAAAVVTYAEQATGSRVTPSRISPLLSDAPSVVDPGAALAETASAPDPAARLAGFNPPQKAYRALREELARVGHESGRVDHASEAAPDLEAGAPAYPTLVAAGAESTSYARSPTKGLGRNVAFTASSEKAMAAASARRRAAILANMEMWRWEPRDMGARHIEVNVPAFSVAVLDGDAVVHTARVVVGKPTTPTPIFSNVMRYVLINPSWRVPDSIIKKEMLPKLAADPQYLSRRGFEVKTVDGRLTVRQRPGEDNALGRIAFMFPNDHSVYLHDTPSQSLFNADMRAFSHGCVRVEDPLRLAELVLGWSEERIDAAIGGPERTVFLPQPVPIHIEYFTEFIDEFGELQERRDVYGLTQKVAIILSGPRQD
jgi:L,D-transpeptidase YcbB